MKIQSRNEYGRYSKYKDHENTSAVQKLHDYGIRVTSVYVPTESCPRDATPAIYLAFGMDRRRFVLELTPDEFLYLKNDMDEALKKIKLRLVRK